jgi:hypothetical protein
MDSPRIPSAAGVSSPRCFSDPCSALSFLAATGGDMTCFATADRLAAFAGLAPATSAPHHPPGTRQDEYAAEAMTGASRRSSSG